MIHLTKKSNKLLGDNQLLEKRVKKVEKGLEHTNVEVGKLKDIIMGGIIDGNNNSSGSGALPVLPPDLSEDIPGLGDI